VVASVAMVVVAAMAGLQSVLALLLPQRWGRTALCLFARRLLAAPPGLHGTSKQRLQ